MVLKSTHSTRAKVKVSPTPASLMSSGGLRSTNVVAIKKESQLIARNPKRFLQSFATGHSRPLKSSLDRLMENMDQDFNGHHFSSTQTKAPGPRSDAELLAKAKEFDDKYRLSKTRTLLLNMSMPSEAGLKTIRGSGGVSNFFQNMTTLSSGSSTPTRNKGPTPRTNFPSSYHHNPGSLAESRDRYRAARSSSSTSSSRSVSPGPRARFNSDSSSRFSNISTSPGASVGAAFDTSASEEPQSKPLPWPLLLKKQSRVYFSDEFAPGEDGGMRREKQLWRRREEEEEAEEQTKKKEEFGYYDKQLDKNNVDEVEGAVQGFIERIKNSDIDKIIVWINTLASMSDVQLPFGYPEHLSIPLDTESISSKELRSYAETSLDDYHLLDAEYSAKLEQLGKRLQDNYESLQSSRWPPKDSALLFYVITALEDGGSATLRNELLTKLFPSAGEEGIATQKYRLRMKRAWEEKRGAILQDWIRDRDDLTRKINEGWNTLQEHLTKKEELASQRREQTERCNYWKGQLDKLRKEKRAKIRRLQILVEPFEAALEEGAKSRVEAEAKARKASAALLAEFRAAQTFARQRRAREKQSLEAQLAENARLQAAYNQSRVSLRHIATEQKKADAKELAVLKMEADMLRVEMLERSKEKVELNYDPSSFLADTHSSLLHRFDIPDSDSALSPEEEEMVAFFRTRYPSHSFSSERVQADRRNRLEGKLRDAGLIYNSYARQVLLALEPKPKPHLVSHIQFKED